MTGETLLNAFFSGLSLLVAAGAFGVAWRANTIAKGEPLLALAQEIRTELRQTLIHTRDKCAGLHAAISRGSSFHVNMLAQLEEAVRVVRVHQEVYLGGDAEEHLASVGDHLEDTRAPLGIKFVQAVPASAGLACPTLAR